MECVRAQARQWTLRGLILACMLVSGACREGDVLRLDELNFDGVQKIDEGALRQVLSTKEGSWLPFSRKPAFNQRQFDEDLKRIKAF